MRESTQYKHNYTTQILLFWSCLRFGLCWQNFHIQTIYLYMYYYTQIERECERERERAKFGKS